MLIFYIVVFTINRGRSTLEIRKVQRVGYSTLSVSLPREWVKDVRLKQGDLVTFLREKDGSLKLMPNDLVERETKVEEFIVNSDLCEEQGMLERIVVGNYILGRDVITITSSDRLRSAHVEEVRRMVRRLFGLGIVEETPNRIVLQCSVDPAKFKIDMLIRRLSVIASTMQSEAVQALLEFDNKLAEDAIRREDEADMVYWLAMRLLLSAQRVRAIAEKTGLEDPLHILYYGLITRYLELIADYAEGIARNAIEFKDCCKEKVSKHVINRVDNLSELAHNIFLKAMDCFFTGDIKIAHNLLEIRKNIKREHEILMKELPEIPHLRTVVWSLTRIADNGAGIAVMAINRALEKPSKMCSPH